MTAQQITAHSGVIPHKPTCLWRCPSCGQTLVVRLIGTRVAFQYAGRTVTRCPNRNCKQRGLNRLYRQMRRAA